LLHAGFLIPPKHTAKAASRPAEEKEMETQTIPPQVGTWNARRARFGGGSGEDTTIEHLEWAII